MQKTENQIKELNKIFWVFIIGSVLGYIFEIIVVIFQKGHFENRQGLIYGPLIPVYGIGGVIYYCVFKKIKTRDLWKVFLISMILGGMTEYISSVVQEKLFHTISWDYSYLYFNLNGRTSLLHCTYWGIAGILYIKYIENFIDKIGVLLERKQLKVLTKFAILFMIFNISISGLAAIRQAKRREDIDPKNEIEILLDKYYPDEYMDNVFVNKMNK